MMMRFRGGGVGHKAVRAATNYFLEDHDALEEPQEHGFEEADMGRLNSVEAGEEQLEHQEDDWGDAHDSDMDDEDGPLASTEAVLAEDSDVDDEELDYGYMSDEPEDEDSNWEGIEDDEAASQNADLLGAEDGEDISDDSENLGYADL